MLKAHDLVLSKSTLFLRSTIWFQILFLDIAGRSWSLVKNKVRKDYPSVQLTAWRVWNNKPSFFCIITLYYHFQSKSNWYANVLTLSYYVFDLQFWPIVGWVNYQYIPLQFRVVFHSFVASCWCVHTFFSLAFLLHLINSPPPSIRANLSCLHAHIDTLESINHILDHINNEP